MNNPNDPLPDAVIAQRIYADFKWELKKLGSPTYEDIQRLLGEAIAKADQQIQTLAIRDAVKEKFQQMQNRTSEFTT